MPLPESVRIEIEPWRQPSDRFSLKAYWTPPGLVERLLILGSDTSRQELASDRAGLENLLLYVYEAGRVDAALGF